MHGVIGFHVICLSHLVFTGGVWQWNRCTIPHFLLCFYSALSVTTNDGDVCAARFCTNADNSLWCTTTTTNQSTHNGRTVTDKLHSTAFFTLKRFLFGVRLSLDSYCCKCIFVSKMFSCFLSIPDDLFWFRHIKTCDLIVFRKIQILFSFLLFFSILNFLVIGFSSNLAG